MVDCIDMREEFFLVELIGLYWKLREMIDNEKYLGVVLYRYNLEY